MRTAAGAYRRTRTRGSAPICELRTAVCAFRDHQMNLLNFLEEPRMPEGDTIFRTAAQLRPIIDGQLIESTSGKVAPRLEPPLVGQRIVGTEARGKHLLLHLSDTRVIHSHMGMTGSWHTYGHHSKWQKPTSFAELALHLPQAVAVCFTPKTLEVLSATDLRRHPHLCQLGPDLLSPAFQLEDVLPRLRVHDRTALGHAIMNQTIVSGIGNVYKSELLFLLRLNPFEPVAHFTDATLGDLLQRARRLLHRNIGGAPRRTRFGRDGQRLWVYNRSGEKCLVCGDTIRMQRQGDLGRSTYWCPTCQPPQTTPA